LGCTCDGLGSVLVVRFVAVGDPLEKPGEPGKRRSREWLRDSRNDVGVHVQAGARRGGEFRRLKGFPLRAKVLAGVRFVDGVENSENQLSRAAA
jgi:hypothetical protein